MRWMYTKYVPFIIHAAVVMYISYLIYIIIRRGVAVHMHEIIIAAAQEHNNKTNKGLITSARRLRSY